MTTSRWTLREVAPELEARYRELGMWDDGSMAPALFSAIEACAHETFTVWSETRAYQGTIGEVGEQAQRVAAAMRAAGIGAGDVVAWQLPNWREAAIAMWGAIGVGAVVLPIADGYGPDDVALILRQSGARLLIAPASFRSRHYVDEVTQRRGGLPELADVWAAESLDDRLGHEPLQPQVRRATDPAMLCYTSGSSSQPKGVIHTHRSMLAEIRQQVREPYAAARRRELVASPVGHVAGLLRMLLLPIFRGNPIFAIDRWRPAEVLSIARSNDLIVGSGVIFFLQSLLDEPTFTPADVVHVSHVGTGGAPIPDAVAERADQLGICLVRSYGSTEHPTISTSPPEETRERRLFTEGRPRSGVDVRITDFDGDLLPAGHEGRVWTRGPDLFAGYVDPSQNTVFSDDGWFETGDLGVLDAHNFLRITGRTKDIVIRGGENVSAAQVERQLLALDAVAEAAVIAAPDERLGERVCAFVRLHPGGGPLDLDSVREQMLAAGSGRHFVPEELHVVESFVRSSTGKLDKHALRAMLDDVRARSARGES